MSVLFLDHTILLCHGDRKVQVTKKCFPGGISGCCGLLGVISFSNKLIYSVLGNCLQLHLLSILSRCEKRIIKFLLRGNSHHCFLLAGAGHGTRLGCFPWLPASHPLLCHSSPCLPHSFVLENGAEAGERWICTGKQQLTVNRGW